MNRLDLYTPDFSRRAYLLGVLIGLDQWLNALLGGYVDETLSSRAFREKRRGWTSLINTIFWFDRQGDLRHCELAYYGELAREHFPRDLSMR